MRELLQRKEALRPHFSINVEKEKNNKKTGGFQKVADLKGASFPVIWPRPPAGGAALRPSGIYSLKRRKHLFCSSDETDRQHLTRGCFFFFFFSEQRDARERASVRFPSVAGRPVGAAPCRYYCLSIFVTRTRLGTTLPTRTVLAAAVTEEAGRGEKNEHKINK